MNANCENVEYLRQPLEGPLLIVDAHPWYEVPEGYLALVEREFAGLGLHVMGAAELDGLVSSLMRAVLRPGDLVVIPLMCGALLGPGTFGPAREARATVVLLPLSRHPFVSLSADPPEELAARCSGYAASSAKLAEDFFPLLEKARHSFSRIVFFDTNSATGRDFVLFRELVAHHLSAPVPTCFSVLVSETAQDETRGPGHRGGPKVKIPDAAALRLIGSNTKFLSHLRFLRRPMAEQLALVDALRGTLPELTTYWETVPADLRPIHNYSASREVIHTKRLHIRPALDDVDRSALLSAAVARLDAAARPEIGPSTPRRREELIGSWHHTMTRLANDEQHTTKGPESHEQR